MSNRLIRNGKLSQIMTNHLSLDFNLVEGLSVIDSNHGADHLGDNNHVSEVGFDRVGLFAFGGFLLSLAELLDETHRLALEASLESPAGSGVNELHELIIIQSFKCCQYIICRHRVLI
jgi:hypothetical protein